MQTSRLRWVVIVVALALAWGSSVPGQATPVQVARAQTTDLFFGVRAEVLFPVVVRFVGGLNMPFSSIQSVSLTVYQGVDFQETVVLVPAEHVLADHGDTVEFVYDWPLTGGPLLTPFEPVDYLWQALMTDGQVAEYEEQFEFVDTRVGSWHSTDDGPVVLHWHNAGLVGEMLLTDIMRAHALLSKHVSNVPPMEIAIYEQNATLCQAVKDDNGVEQLVLESREDGRQYACSEQAYKSFYETAGITYLKRDGYAYAGLQSTLITALVRGTYAPLWRDKAVPAWFEVGLAGMYHLQANIAALETARAAGRTESLLTLDTLTFDPADDWLQADQKLWEAESYLLVLYLADQFGAEAPFDLAQRVVAGADNFEAAFTAYTGRDLQLFWVEWERWLYARAARDAANWTPYLAATPIPAPTVGPTYTPTGEYVPPSNN